MPDVHLLAEALGHLAASLEAIDEIDRGRAEALTLAGWLDDPRARALCVQLEQAARATP